jgi:hypothetical protein
METGLAQNRSFSAPVGGFFEYLLVAHPDATVYAQVMAEKQLFTAQYHEQVAIKTKPHITVANFPGERRNGTHHYPVDAPCDQHTEKI